MTAPKKLRAVKTLVRVTLSDSFKIRPRTEVSSLLIVQLAAKIQSPNPGWSSLTTSVVGLEARLHVFSSIVMWIKPLQHCNTLPGGDHTYKAAAWQRPALFLTISG